MQHVLVIQSAAEQAPAWQQRCMGSVQTWAASQGYAYRFLGDELFEQVPDWYMEKVRGRMPIAADLGRLQWIERLLSEGYSLGALVRRGCVGVRPKSTGHCAG